MRITTKIMQLATAAMFLLALSLTAQTNSQDAPPATPPPPAPPARQAPEGISACLQQAGIGKSTAEQFRTIEQDTRAQIESLRNNQSLAPRQRQQQIAEIRRQAMQKRDALVSPDQQRKLRSCLQQHAGRSSPDTMH